MMIMRLGLAASSALALLASPATLAAQETPPPITVAEMPVRDDPGGPGGPAVDDPDMSAMLGMLGGAAKPEPLTPEQQARLPQAEAIIARIWPVGATAELSEGMFGGMFGGFGELLPSGPKPALARSLGLAPIDLEAVSDAAAAEALSLLDPVWKEREEAQKAMVPELIGEVVNLVEPPMRRAMTELYAIRFSGPELAAIDAFFATETGGKYARESLTMASDPRLLSASMEAMPAMFAMISQIEDRMKARTASLPEPREFADLSPKDRARVAELTGIPEEDIENTTGAGVITVPSPPLAVPPQTD